MKTSLLEHMVRAKVTAIMTLLTLLNAPLSHAHFNGKLHDTHVIPEFIYPLIIALLFVGVYVYRLHKRS